MPEDLSAALEQYLYAASLKHGRAALFAGNLLHSRASSPRSSGKAGAPYTAEQVTADFQLAGRMFKQAAEAGHGEAMNSYAILLEVSVLVRNKPS